MTCRLYTIPTCKTCIEFENRLRQVCHDFGYKFETFDLDSDPISSLAVLKEFRGAIDGIPFFGLYDRDLSCINLYSGTSYDDAELIHILLKHDR